MFESFNNYRNSLGIKPVTPYEQTMILNPLLQDNIIAKNIAIKMLGDNNPNNDFLGYLLASQAWR